MNSLNSIKRTGKYNIHEDKIRFGGSLQKFECTFTGGLWLKDTICFSSNSMR